MWKVDIQGCIDKYNLEKFKNANGVDSLNKAIANKMTMYKLAGIVRPDSTQRSAYTNLYYIQKGKSKMISYELIGSICEALECSPGDLFVKTMDFEQSEKTKEK